MSQLHVRSRTVKRVMACLFFIWGCGATLYAQNSDEPAVPEGAPPIPVTPQPIAALGGEADLIGLAATRQQRDFKNLNGKGLTCAIIDSGLNKKHSDFDPARILCEVNFTDDNNKDPMDASEAVGHGTHVAGIIGAAGIHRGIAPAVAFVPIKILPKNPDTVSTNMRLLEALKWVNQNHSRYGITIVNICLADPRLLKSDNFPQNSTEGKIRKEIVLLRAERIPVVISAGNHYGRRNKSESSKPLLEGMGFPAIIRETISVGATYARETQDELSHPSYDSKAYGTVQWQIAPFSARLSAFEGLATRDCQTDLFAPGGELMESTGAGVDGSSHYLEGGTSQAAPQVTGAILLLQQFWKDQQNELPEVDELQRWLQEAEKPIRDGDDEFDDVRHTCGVFRVLNIYNSLLLAQKSIPLN